MQCYTEPYQKIYFQILIGIVSWGNKCASQGYPGVNVEVSRFVEWISNIIEKNTTPSPDITSTSPANNTAELPRPVLSILVVILIFTFNSCFG